MATLTPTLTLSSTNALTDTLNMTVTDSLSITGDVKQFTKVLATTTKALLAAGDYNKTYVFLKNKSATAVEIITIQKKSTVGGGSYNNGTNIDVTSTANISFGMTVTGSGIPGGATVASVTDTNTFVLSDTTTGGAKSSQTLTFGMETFLALGAGEWAFFPWDSNTDLDAISASGTPTLEVMIFEAT